MQQCLQMPAVMALPGHIRALKVAAASRLAVSTQPGSVWSSAPALRAAPGSRHDVPEAAKDGQACNSMRQNLPFALTTLSEFTGQLKHLIAGREW